MRKWVLCHICGCTGFHHDPATDRDYPCPNHCDGGRVYRDAHPDWFERLVRYGATIHEDAETEAVGAGR
ncbi:MAG TPA: hypothetical protein PL151_13305 [Phycisphaerae bacterium]|nr:hypothetical protein [Phycisphaerae bacterium]HOQ86806.1 hypothetical protein [Phycisphaerae bacterium]HPU26559.1 hypothetical protein [Phycisphaerae bacterium]HPZ98572.1 hypothetical protein [Phycisphaerae bacterium]HQE28730.1 hypothetical protein [Phycisphaerae bacterium]